MARIHPTALVDPAAELAADVEIGPFTLVEAGVQIGAGTCVGAHCTLAGGLRIGRGVRIFNYACLATHSQDLKYCGGDAWVELGDEVIVREFVTVNRGTRPGSVTRIGAGAVLMAYAHVAHECALGERVILTNAATLGGEVRIGRGAVIGGLAGVHQFCRIGEFAIIGANSKVTQDVGPYLMADGHPARPFGPNLVGLRRNGFGEAEIKEIRRIYRELFNRARTLSENVRLVEAHFAQSARAQGILQFVKGGTRGLARPRPRRVPSAEFADYALGDTPPQHD